MESSVEEPEIGFLTEPKFGPDLFAVHRAFEREESRLGTLVRNRGFPGGIIAFCQCQRLLARVEIERVAKPRVAHEMDGDDFGVVEDHPSPSIGVGDQGRSRLAVDLEFINVPDAIQGRFRRELAVSFAAFGSAHQCHAEVKNDQQSSKHDPDPVQPPSAEEWAVLGGFHSAIQDEQPGEPIEVREHQEERHGQEVTRKEFDGNVIAEVEREHVAENADAYECSQQGGVASGQEQAAGQFAAPVNRL